MTKILLVEDHPANLEIYRTILEYSGYEVVEAMDGEAALRQAREAFPALILLDISIPLIDGWDVVAALKADSETRHIPVVPITAHAEEADRERAAAAGCHGYLCKPVSPMDVLAEIERVLGDVVGSGEGGHRAFERLGGRDGR